MNNEPLVSVITPFHNSEKFLEEAATSVLAQTYNRVEFLLVDDGSRDGSRAIATRFAERFPDKVRYLEHANGRNLGKSASRNLGIRQAEGEYVAFLDADDVFLPQKLERQVSILEAHREAGMVYGATNYWYSWTGDPADRRRDRKAPLGVSPDTLWHPPMLLRLFLRRTAVVPCTCGLLARRRVAEEIGGFEDVTHAMYEDQTFLAKMCLAAPVFVESGSWDRYRQHPYSSSRLAIQAGQYHPMDPNPARRAFLDWLASYLTERHIQDQDLWKAHHRAMWPYRHPELARWMGRITRVTRRSLRSIVRTFTREG